jgi:hypothetical protein
LQKIRILTLLSLSLCIEIRDINLIKKRKIMETMTKLIVLQELADIIIAKNKAKWSKSSDNRIKAFQSAYNDEARLIKLLTPKAA